MRIAQFIDSLHVGGAEKLLVTLAAAARARHLPLTVLSLREAPGIIPDQLRAEGAQVLTLGGRGLLDGRRLARLTRFLRQGRFDILQTHLTFANILGVVAARLAGVPVVATIHSAALDTKHPPFKHQLEAWAMRWGAQAVVAVGYAAAEAQQARVGRAIEVVPNAVAAPATISPAERHALRAEVAGQPDRPLLISVGRLVDAKGYPDMLVAFDMVRQAQPAAQLLIVGEGPMRAQLAGQIEALGLGGAAHLLGSRDDVPRLLAASDLYLSASHWEGLPLSILEAMAAGLPVVATSVGEMPRLLGGGLGMLVPPHQPVALAEAVGALLGAPGQRAALGAAARTYVVETHSPQAWMEQLLQVYHKARGDG